MEVLETMQSIFNKACDERVSMAAAIAFDWIDTHWNEIEDIFNLLRSSNNNTVIVTQSTLNSWQEKVEDHYEEGWEKVFPRGAGFTYHSGDTFPEGRHPLTLNLDPILDVSHAVSNDSFIQSIAQQSPKTFFFFIQTTKDLGKIERSNNVFTLALPKLVLKEDMLFKTNCVGEVASLIFFGELRYRGVFSHLWVDFHYNEVEHLTNKHFSTIVQESFVSPFFISPKISTNAILMGFAYEDYKPQSIKRKLSPVRRKRVIPTSERSPPLQKKPTITRPPSPPRKQPEEKEEEKPKEKKKKKKGKKKNKKKPKITNDEQEETPAESHERVSTLPPSPQRKPPTQSEPPQTKLSEDEDLPQPDEKEKDPQQKETPPKRKTKTKRRIINPETGRKILVGGETYNKLVEAGIINE